MDLLRIKLKILRYQSTASTQTDDVVHNMTLKQNLTNTGNLTQKTQNIKKPKLFDAASHPLQGKQFKINICNAIEIY